MGEMTEDILNGESCWCGEYHLVKCPDGKTRALEAGFPVACREDHKESEDQMTAKEFIKEFGYPKGNSIG